MSTKRSTGNEGKMSRRGPILAFGPFGFDVEACRLSRDGIEIHLTPKAAAVLCLLVQHPGELITKDEFLENVWEGVFVREESLTQAISTIRQTLGDSAQSPQYIETVSGEGYRFIAELAEIDPSHSPPPEIRAERSSQKSDQHGLGGGLPHPPAYGITNPRRAPWMLAGAALAVVSLLAAAWLLRLPPALSTDPNVKPITSFPGYERWPALSPNGTQVAFTWDGGNGGRRHLWVKMLEGSEAKQLTFDDRAAHAPAWSPRGDFIAYLRWNRGDPEYEIRTITPIGTDDAVVVRRSDCVSAVNGLDWSPDGEYLAFPDCSPDGGPGVFLLAMRDRSVTQVTFAPQDSRPFIDVMPKFSPDGRFLAFIRKTLNGQDVVQVHVQEIADGTAQGEPRSMHSINASNGLVYDVDWTNGGDDLVWSGGITFVNTFLNVTSVADDTTRRLAGGERVRHFSIVDNLLVYSKFQDDYSIWRIGGPAGEAPGLPVKWGSSTWDDAQPRYSPTGDRVAFVSDREGTMDVWVSDADGEAPRRLVETPWAFAPQFSRDGERIAFGAIMGSGGARIYVIPAEGGEPLDLSGADVGDTGSTWSTDNEWIYFRSERGGGDGYEIWGVRADGSGEFKQIARDTRAVRLHRSRLYYRSNRQIWSVNEDGEDKRLELDMHVPVTAWTFWDGKLLYMEALPPGAQRDSSTPAVRAAINILDMETLDKRRLATVGFAGPIDGRYSMSVSPDGRFILFSGREYAGSDLVLVENFR